MISISLAAAADPIRWIPPVLEHRYDRSLTGHLVFLGTGTSLGVPAVGCGCPVCKSAHPRNQRSRCGVVLGLPEGYLLIDTPTDLRTQLLRERIGLIDAIAFTHSHADHVFGLDDVRPFSLYLGHPLPVYCEAEVEDRIRQSFDYAFSPEPATHQGATPQLEFIRIGTEPFEVLGARITPIRLRHGRFQVLGFRVGNVAYCTDTNGIPEESLARLTGLDVLILGALRHRPHPTHFSLSEAIDVAEQIRAKRTLFTHISHDLEHQATNAELPAGMELAYDGMQIELT